MTQERPLKITCHIKPKKLVYVLPLPSQNYSFLRRHLELYLFKERLLPEFDIRTYWIDSENDEVEIESQNDYKMFLAHHITFDKPMHMQIGYLEKIDTVNECVVHPHIICDSCKLKPIIGFRYKCLQCPDFDLCQRCEAQHKHRNHAMIRVPVNDFFHKYNVSLIIK